MNLNNSTVLLLGGFGLVGSAIARKISEHKPKKIIISSLKESESVQAVEEFNKEFDDIEFIPEWGNVFTRTEWKDEPYWKLLEDSEKRIDIIQDTFSDLNETIKQNSFLFTLLTKHNPDLVIDCINTATGIAYLDIYNSSLNVINDLIEKKLNQENVEKLLSSIYVPQLIRHIQILGEAFDAAKVNMYIKIGTSGTGGMGLNIPYTHSEDRPSRVLMSKTALAGAQSLLMYLMARTPGKTIVKEIKPTATIAWKKISYGNVTKGGNPIKLFDMKPENALDCNGELDFNYEDFEDLNQNLQSVFIDTGENGIFSKGEFETISSLGQMEMVTPEEIADLAVFEALGGNTGKDIIQGLDAFSLGPSYRGAYLRAIALETLNKLEEEHGEGVAFELLGPPRLSKLLYEANLIKLTYGNFINFLNTDINEATKKINNLIGEKDKLRSKILSIGLPILLNNGKYLRGSVIKVPQNKNWINKNINQENLDKWTYDGWIDLREVNFVLWKERFNSIIKNTENLVGDTTGSRYFYTKNYWNNFEFIDEGKLAAWIFEFEDKGWRFKR